MPGATHHLLRTLAAVAPGTRVVDAACGDGRHLVPLAQLGFDVWGAAADVAAARDALAAVAGPHEAARRVTPAPPDALGYPDGWADWVVLTAPPPDRLAHALAEAARVLAPGGWLWATGADAERLGAAALGAGLVEAEAAGEADGETHAVYRRPGTVR